ncbi:MAG: circadian clock KaiB family protein [Dehalococcoidia bacterium]
MNKVVLKLYTAGKNLSPQESATLENLRRICDAELGGQYELEIIDILENPAIAEAEEIIATPTLVKELPPPPKRIIGEISNTEKILMELELERIIEK